MSRENIIKFYEEVQKNENLKKEFEGLKSNVESGKETKKERQKTNKIIKVFQKITMRMNFQY